MIVNQNASKIANMVVDRNWLDRGQNSVCITYGKCSNVNLREVFERNSHLAEQPLRPQPVGVRQ